MAQLTKKEREERDKEKRMKVKNSQVGVCQFVQVEVQTFDKLPDGDWQRSGSEFHYGLQYENRVLLLNGIIRSINCSSVRIKKKYEFIPTWATSEMKQKYMDNFLFDIPAF